MSPILTRPVREQLEHDRVIRQLQARYKRKLDVIINPGNEQNQSVMIGELAVFPDLVLYVEGTRRLVGTVEVETGESVNSIEARAEWGYFAKLKVPLHLYVPPVCVDAVGWPAPRCRCVCCARCGKACRHCADIDRTWCWAWVAIWPCRVV